MRKTPRLSKARYGILLGLCLLSAQLVGTQPARATDASREEVPPKYQAFVSETGYRGVIDDPDGYVNLRSGKSTDAPVVAKVKAGEAFSFEREGGDGWCKVKLATGKSGWMHHSRIRLFYTMDDLPAKSDQDEIDKQARRRGVDYYQITQGAVRGDPEARKKFFSVTEYADGAGAEQHWGVFRVVIHLIGDEALARFLRGQPVAYRKSVRDSFPDDATYPFEPREYMRRHFPKTARILF
jgi:SH3 domain-containing protein